MGANLFSCINQQHALTNDYTDHVFVAFIGASELKITNLSKADVKHIRAEVLHGVESETAHGTVWTVHFRGQPWASKGDDSFR